MGRSAYDDKQNFHNLFPNRTFKYLTYPYLVIVRKGNDMKSINITFEDTEFEDLKTKKLALSKKLNKQLSWKEYFIERSKE